MEEHVLKALYLGCYVLMLILAFTSFFSAYSGHQSHVSAVQDDDGPQYGIRQDIYYENDGWLTGREAISLIIAKRRYEAKKELAGLYRDEPNSAADEEYPDVLIDGISYRNADVKGIDPGGLYECNVVFDPYGKPSVIELRRR